MVNHYRDPAFFSFAALSKKLGITQSRIQDDYLVGNINKFLIDNMYAVSTPGTKRRIAKLMPILNMYAREHINESPASILAVPLYYAVVQLSGQKVQFLLDNINSNSIFKFWLKEYGLDIETIRIVIPTDEAARYEEFLKNVPSKSTDLRDFDVKEYVTKIREKLECNPTTCYNCKNYKCRNQLAYDIFTNYGDHTHYRVSLCEIGIAMGCSEPPWAKDKSNTGQMKRQRKETEAIKSRVSRWKAEHAKIVTPSHLTVTP